MPYEEQFAALSHPLRQQILDMLQDQARSVRQLTDATGASQPVVSQHLKVLSQAGLVGVTPDGKKRLYHIENAQLHALRQYLTQHWQDALGGLTDEGAHDA